MLPNRVQTLVAFFLCNDARWATSFAHHGVHSHQRWTLARNESPRGVPETEQGRNKGSTKLEFKGELEIKSGPLASLPDKEMTAFFETAEYRNLLVTAGGKRSCEEISLTDKTLKDWQSACNVVGAEHPDERGDVVISVRTGGLDLPGLQVQSKARIGSKLIQQPSPRYEFVLIGDERSVSGFPAMVWIFNKLTGGGDGNGESDNTSASSLSVITYNKTDDGKIVFMIRSSISIEVNFPSVLLKILPTNKEKAEETGGKAITKTIEKDVQASMEAFVEAYVKFAD